MTVKFANNATSKLAVSISATDTTITVQAGEGNRFPATTSGDTFPVTLVKATGQLEICRCTARSSDILTIIRGQENTVAAAFNAGDRIELRMTNEAYEERLGEKFDKTGGDLSGPVTLKGAGEKVIVERQAAGEASILSIKTTSGTKRWEIVLPDSTTDDIAIKRFDDAGADKGGALTIVRSTGEVQAGAFRAATAIRFAGSDGVLPVYSSPPTQNVGEVYVPGIGAMKWNGTKYVPSMDDILPWLGAPVGGYITSNSPPPTDNPRFRYIVCSAGVTGSGGYNEGALTAESVSGSAPLITATAVVALLDSPLLNTVVHLINTEERFIGASRQADQRVQDDALQNITGTPAIGPVVGSSVTGAFSFVDTGPAYISGAAAGRYGYNSFDASRVARTSNNTRPRSIMVCHYMRIK